ncbi:MULTISPECIES: hypothetical protein [unclassified Paenibacillus]|uniref:hypothetical protein n=1 Tax=unclassified Paenibacillus TaxID=185978 RepID=UPI0009ACCF01|nr:MULTISPECIES: hypothetical protein [unclassified Paenibacillus]MBE1443508.1 hypothetical protein [Paenibacillus sp. OAS669]
MSGKSKDNVILFPKTVEFYQFELTRMLETERYGEAIELLSFLLSCQSPDERASEEWRALLQWLQTMFPDALAAMPDGEQEDYTEQDLLREHVAAKAREDRGYTDKLLGMLSESGSMEHQLLALGQLALLDDPGINGRLVEWLGSEERHPMIQYKTLQTLKLRGMSGMLRLPKNGETLFVEIEDTPSDFDQFPPQINEILERIRENSQTGHPALAYFAEETWNEFLAFVYGTPIYRQMLLMESENVDAWAAAFHLVLLERVFDSGDREEIFELYGITNELMFQWEQAYRIMQQFAAATFTARLHD